jgi:hypothetical protein
MYTLPAKAPVVSSTASHSLSSVTVTPLVSLTLTGRVQVSPPSSERETAMLIRRERWMSIVA